MLRHKNLIRSTDEKTDCYPLLADAYTLVKSPGSAEYDRSRFFVESFTWCFGPDYTLYNYGLAVAGQRLPRHFPADPMLIG
jgi:hypothetical protein